jgi:monoamine oxidase
MDNLSLEEYFKSLGAATWFTTLLDTAYMSEYGLATAEQSPLNFLDMIDTEATTEFNIYGDSDERYKIKGGNASLTQAMAQAFQDDIITGMQLTGLYSVGKRNLMVFNERQSMETDMIILTIPFTQLRNIPLQLDGITKVKKLCIDELGYGSNAKVMMGFKKRTWRTEGYMGYLLNEEIHNGWDNGLFQNDPFNNAEQGGYTVYLGGAAGLEVIRGNEQELARKYVGQLERVFPGIAEQYNGMAALADWPQNPFVKGSYACYKMGQWTTISGLEIEPIGNVYFAGEHCSDASQGYMNGGAETGRMVAQTIIKRLKGK